MPYRDISFKANRILHGILIALLVILARVFYLSVMQCDQKREEAQKPQRKVIVEAAVRATIRDRFGLPLAVNKIAYQAAILYDPLSQIRSVVWEKNAAGRRIKVPKRKIYIQQLAQLLARELGLDRERIEDLIHAKAAHYTQKPFVIKEGLTEREYYRLKALEKDWPGLHVRHVPKREYPKGRVAADIVGYMGAMNREEHASVVDRLRELKEQIASLEQTENFSTGEPSALLPLRRELEELESKAYTMQDEVGKTGIEKVYERQLRGSYGKKYFSIDSKGQLLREIPGSRPPLSGRPLLLSLSSELQEYAEQLLAQNETVRIVRQSALGAAKHTVNAKKEPWIKGGAIVALDPGTGEVIALASYPRFDPNDFVGSRGDEQYREKQEGIHRWFESELYVAQVWNRQRPLERERYDVQRHLFYDEPRWMNWEGYLDFILPKEGALRQAMENVQSLAQAIEIQRQAALLQSYFPSHDLYALFNFLYGDEPHECYGPSPPESDFCSEEVRDKISQIKERLDRYLNRVKRNYDKVLLVDLCRLAVDGERFSPELIKRRGQERLERYHEQSGSLVTLFALVKESAQELYHDLDFKRWRELEERDFLKAKRGEERRSKSPPKAYLDYLDRQEKKMFEAFWSAHSWECLLAFLSGKQAQSCAGDRTFEDLYPNKLKNGGVDSAQAPGCGRLEADVGTRELALKPETDSSTCLGISHYLSHFRDWRREIRQGGYQGAKWKKAYDCLERPIRDLPGTLAIDYLKTMRSFQELRRPLLGRYRGLRQPRAPLEKHLAAAFYPLYGFGYGRSHAYRQSTTQGSLFKVVTAYEALVQHLRRIGGRALSPQELNPLVMTDEVYHKKGVRYVGYSEDGVPIPQLYKGGRLPRSLAHQHIGRVDLIRALELSSNPYFSLLAGECLEHPDDLAAAAKLFGYGSRTGIDLPGEIPGKVPEDLSTNRTGLYAMAIGQHSLVVTPLQTAVMLAAIANGGKVLRPKLVKVPTDSITPLPEVAVQDRVARELFMPEPIRQILLRGLRAATLRSHQENMTSLTRLYKNQPEAIRQFSALKGQLLGKTSTSESVERIDLDLEKGTNLYTHVWFGAIAFRNGQAEKSPSLFLLKDEFGQPELVVVVYLRYGGYGKEAAPLAAQIVAKWREIKQKHGATVHKV